MEATRILEFLALVGVVYVSVRVGLPWAVRKRPGARSGSKWQDRLSSRAWSLAKILGCCGIILFSVDVLGEQSHRERAVSRGVSFVGSSSIGLDGVSRNSTTRSEEFGVSRGTFRTSPKQGPLEVTYRRGRVSGWIYVLKYHRPKT